MTETLANYPYTVQKSEDAFSAFEKERVNILIVDDLPEKMMAYEAILEELGQNLIMVRSGEEALKLVLKQEFAVILLDVNMPGMDGFEAASLIRKRKKSSHTPIIFLTAFNDEIRMAQGYASGAVDYLPTPVVPEVLRAKVRVFIELSQMRRQAALQAEEHAMRKAAEETAHRLEFLATASEIFARSKNQCEILTTLTHFVIPYLADMSLVCFSEDEIQQVGYYNAELTPGDSVDLQQYDTMPFPQLARHIKKVIDTGVVEQLDTITPAALKPNVNSTKHILPYTKDSNGVYSSVLILPFYLREKISGVLLLAKRNTAVGYSQHDISLATNLITRASVALENILLMEKIQDADKKKNEFLAMLAHELRNPLAPIRNALQIIKRTERQDLRLQAELTIERQIKHMVHLVDDLMDVSRITQGKIELRKEIFNLSDALNHAIETVQPLFKQLGHHFTVEFPDKPILLNADFARISQIFSNLLNNAAKYTNKGGIISLNVTLEGMHVLISVKDNGIGIPQEMLPHIFEMFSQVDSSLERTQGGLGIGLTLVKSLVELHDGGISVSSGSSQGSEFIVRLPFVENASVEIESLPVVENEPQMQHALKVLVVDDNDASAKTLGWMMELVGHEIKMAHDGSTAINIAKQYNPDVILLDIGLPIMNGYEVCKNLREDAQFKNTIFIAQTGWGQAEHRQRSKYAGFDYHLVKPVDMHALQKLMSELVEKRSNS